jgi:hypothetical protein
VVAVQRGIEMIGIPTVLITLDPDQSGMMYPPRAIHPKGFVFSHSLGKPFDRDTQIAVFKATLQQLITKQEPGQIHEVDFQTY